MPALPKREFELHKFGRNPDVDAGGVDIWDGTGAYEFPLVAFETSIIAGSNDVVGSNGVHTVQVEGLDINGVDVTEVVTLTGNAAVVLANSYFRVNRAFIKLTGANKINSWNIDITHTGSATLARISADEGQTLQAIYTVPANVGGTVTGWYVNAARAANKVDVQASIRFQTRELGEGWRTQDSSEVSNTQDVVRNFKTTVGISLKPLMDVRMRVTSINTNNVVVSGGFEVIGNRSI